MKKVKILVCCHKQDVIATQEPYLPIHVGKALSNTDLGIQSDNEGENISFKNRSYCELTGMYWAWKNLKDIDVIGLCHYRRYFDFHRQCDNVFSETFFNTRDFTSVDFSIPQDIIDSIHEGMAYVTKPKYYRHSLYDDYCNQHISDDIRKLEKYIYETQPYNIRWAWYECMHRSCHIWHYNMFIMTWSDFNAYCSWLFPILAEMEKQIDITYYTSVQGRIFGYMAERLMNVWLTANKFTVKERPLIMFYDYPGTRSTSHLKYIRNSLRCKLLLRLMAGKNPIKQ